MSPTMEGHSPSGELNISKKEVAENAPTETTNEHEQSRDNYATHSTYDDENLLGEFVGTDEDCILGEAKKQEVVMAPPTLPQKSTLRASRLLNSLKITPVETPGMSTPHDVYLSSEEDPSSSADDFDDISDYDYESASEESQKSPVRRKSHEDTARVVSVVYSGKPSIVDLPCSRRSISPGSAETRPESMTQRRAFAPRNYPPRTDSYRASTISTGRRPSFLDTDPYADSNYVLDKSKSEDGHDIISPRTPKTPTAVMHQVQRTFSLVRKRSQPMLQSFKARMSRDSLTLNPSSSSLNLLATASTPGEESKSPEKKVAESARPPSPVLYDDIIKISKKNRASVVRPPLRQQTQPLPSKQPMSPISPATVKRGLFNGLNLVRRRSMKAG